MVIITGMQKHSITLPTQLSSDVQKRVGKRGFSGYVAAATRRQLERDAIDDLLAEMEAENGEVPPAKIDQIMECLQTNRNSDAL